MGTRWRWLVLSYAALIACGIAGCGGGTRRPPQDGGADAALDAGADATVDAGDDASIDADAGADASVDAAVDAAADADVPPPPGEHLLFSELVVIPTGSEFFELWNPTASAVDLSAYHVADNSAYTRYATGVPWAPVETAGTDFLVRFPAGATIAPDARLVVAMNPGFEAAFGRCPDFVVSATGTALSCTTGSVPAMLIPANGGVGATATLSNDREMLVLFVWTGVAGDLVEDVDYLTWGTTFDDASRVDKTAIAGYAADTARAAQTGAIAPVLNESIGRCGAIETGEPSASGNGLSGHDETGERLDTAFSSFTTPSPGVANVCP